MELNEELLQKFSQAESTDKLIALAKTEGIELTKEKAEKIFEILHSDEELSDDMLDDVAGGIPFSSMVSAVAKVFV